MRIETVEALEALYGTPNLASTAKVADHLTPQYRRLIEASPFMVLATVGPEGLDASPRGDAHGLVRIADEATLLLPDRRQHHEGGGFDQPPVLRRDPIRDLGGRGEVGRAVERFQRLHRLDPHGRDPLCCRRIA